MKEEDLTKLTDSIKEKLGEEGTATIADDLGILITKNNEVLEELREKDKQISSLTEQKDKLVQANGALLKQVPMGVNDNSSKEKESEDSESEYFDYHSIFDNNGNIKENM